MIPNEQERADRRRSKGATISAEERAHRRWLIDDARHSSAMEGARSSEATWALQERWVAGEIDLDEFIELTKAGE